MVNIKYSAITDVSLYFLLDMVELKYVSLLGSSLFTILVLGSVIQDHSEDHDASKEPMNPLPSQVHWLL